MEPAAIVFFIGVGLILVGAIRSAISSRGGYKISKEQWELYRMDFMERHGLDEDGSSRYSPSTVAQARRVRVITDEQLAHARVQPAYEEYVLASEDAKFAERLYVVKNDGISSSSLPYVRIVPSRRASLSAKQAIVVNPEDLPLSVKFPWYY